MDDRTSEKKQNNPRSGNNNGSKGKSNNKRPPPPRPVQVSKKIAWLLRHGAEKEHLTLDSAGFANVHDVLENRNLKSLKVTFDELRACVRENDKQRFTLKLKSKSADTKDDDENENENEKESKNPSDYLIRANQGHSLKKIIQDQELLQPITATEENNIPAMAIHGTTKNAWKLIVASGGLKPMGRNHIHFAPGVPAGFDKDNKSTEATTSTATTMMIDDDTDDGEGKEGKEKEKEKEIPVISGIRASSKILIYLDLAKAMQAGIKFWRSDNGVILSEGDENGLISMHFFQRVEDRTKEGGGAILIRDGKLLSGEAIAVSNT